MQIMYIHKTIKNVIILHLSQRTIWYIISDILAMLAK